MRETRVPTKLRANPILGLKVGLGVGVIFLLYAGLRVGSLQVPPEIAATYLLGGAVGGLVAGACIPLARTRAGASLLGIIAGAPFFGLFGILDASVRGSDAVPFWAYAVSAVLVGALSGYLIRHTQHRDLDQLRP